MKLRLLAAARRDVAEAAEYYDTRQRGLGDELLASVHAVLEQIEARPEAFANLETLPKSLGYRRAQLKRFPFLVMYRIATNEVVVAAVVHAHRRPNFWLTRDKE